MECRPRDAYHALLPFALLLGPVAAYVAWDGWAFELTLPVAVIAGLGMLRFGIWRARGAGRLCDVNGELAYVRRGKVVRSAPWPEITSVLLDRNIWLPPQWSVERERGLSSLPGVWVSVRGEPPQGVYDKPFATLLLVWRRDIAAAEQALAAECRSRGIRFSSPDFPSRLADYPNGGRLPLGAPTPGNGPNVPQSPGRPTAR